MATTAIKTSQASWRDYLELCKPNVVLLIVFTAVVGMLLAAPGMVPLDVLVFGTLGIGLASASAAAINHVVDRRIDAIMGRTRGRPLPQGAVNSRDALTFALDVVTKNTVLDGTKVTIIDVPAKARCESCGEEFLLEDYFSPCPACGAFQSETLQGQELRVKSLIVDE